MPRDGQVYCANCSRPQITHHPATRQCKSKDGRQWLNFTFEALPPTTPNYKAVAEDVKQAAEIIDAARKRIGPPGGPPSMLWSALNEMWDHLNILQKAIESGEYT